MKSDFFDDLTFRKFVLYQNVIIRPNKSAYVLKIKFISADLQSPVPHYLPALKFFEHYYGKP